MKINVCVAALSVVGALAASYTYDLGWGATIFSAAAPIVLVTLIESSGPPFDVCWYDQKGVCHYEKRAVSLKKAKKMVQRLCENPEAKRVLIKDAEGRIALEWLVGVGCRGYPTYDRPLDLG